MSKILTMYSLYYTVGGVIYFSYIYFFKVMLLIDLYVLQKVLVQMNYES